MPSYLYTARDSTGAAVNGTMTAASSDEVAKNLRGSGKYVVNIRETSATTSNESGAARSVRGIKVSREEVIQLSTQLAIMLETGVTLAEALDCCAINSNRPQLKKLLDDLASQVNQGVDFSVALARHPRSFPRLYVALIQASEKSGMMSKLLGRATTYMRDEQEILRKVKGALTYPCIMLGFAVVTTLFLLAFVLPRFAALYEGKGAALPVPTKILMTLSNALLHHWMLVVPGTALAVAIGWVFLRSPTGRTVRDYVSIHAPLIGSMFRKLHLSRGLRTVGTMATSGVSLVDCVEIARSLSGNAYYGRLWDDVSAEIQIGKPFSDPLSRSPLVPGAVSRMLHSGEKSGKLATVMEQVATFAEQELKEKIAELTRYIEPAMICLMGLLIGGITLALLLPVFTISRVVSQ